MESVYENLLNVVQTWWQSFIDNLPSLVAGLVIFLLSLYLARVLSRTAKRVMGRRKEDRELTMLELQRRMLWNAHSRRKASRARILGERLL